jgi:ribosomal protein S18 acetylase RimI-like enzyme
MNDPDSSSHRPEMAQSVLTIRPYQAGDWSTIWPLLQSTFSTGDTYSFAPDSSEEDIQTAWIDYPLATYVACTSDGTVVGTYFLKANQTGLGSHVCNCGYVVSPAARGQGVASALCVHSQETARAAGFKSMQFNLVVATNLKAVRLWQYLGFAIVGTLPGAFQHQRLGFVDAHVMFKHLQ